MALAEAKIGRQKGGTALVAATEASWGGAGFILGAGDKRC